MARIAGVNIPKRKRVWIALSAVRRLRLRVQSSNSNAVRINWRLVWGHTRPFTIQPDVLSVHFSEKRGSTMIKSIQNCTQAAALLRGSAGGHDGAGTRDLVSGSNSNGTIASQDAGVVEFSQKRVRDGLATDEPTVPERSKLQLRVDPQTRAFIDDLVMRAEAESISEVVRVALREYERVLCEFESIDEPNSDIVAEGIMNAQPKSLPQSKRLNVVLSRRSLARLARLAIATSARSQSDVIRMALCVLDARLAEFDAIIAGNDNVSVLDRVRASFVARSQKKSSLG